MYRVTVNGIDYSAPDLPTLQQWAREGRLLPDTFVWVEAMQRHVKATEVPGLTFPNQQQNFSVPPGPASYPRQGGYTNYQKVNNNLILAIFSTVCCCLPFGVVSIVYASQVDGHAARGDIAKANDSAEKAKNWAIASIVCGVIGNLAYIALMVGSGEFSRY
jgi:hypothetical protein